MEKKSDRGIYDKFRNYTRVLYIKLSKISNSAGNVCTGGSFQRDDLVEYGTFDRTLAYAPSLLRPGLN